MPTSVHLPVTARPALRVSRSASGADVVVAALTGAEGLIPDSARHYSVTLEWWLEDGEWKLARLGWE